MEVEGKDISGEQVDVDKPIEEETGFNTGAGGGLDPSVQQSINFHNNPEAEANSVLSAKGWPDLANIQNQFPDNIDKRLIAAAVIKYARDYSDLPTFIKSFNDLIAKGVTYDSFVQTNFHSQEQIEQYLKSQAQPPPTDTPGVDIHTQNQINLRLTGLGVDTTTDHSKFIPLENGGLAVKTSKGSVTITQKNKPKLYLKDPGIPKAEYPTLLGFTREEYRKRVDIHNTKIVTPADDLVDGDQDSLDDFTASLLGTGRSTPKEGPNYASRIATAIKDKVSNFMDRIKANRIRSEYDYQALGTIDDDDMEMTEFDAEHPHRLPEREIEAIDKRFQTIEGQLQIATSKVGEITTQIVDLENKQDKSADEQQKLNDFNDELQGQIEIVASLKGQLAENTEKMRKQRNIALGITGAAVAGGVFAGIFELVANALGSDAAKDLLPKSADPKDIAASGIGKAVTNKLAGLAGYFHDKYIASTGTMKSFWHMMENAVKFMQQHLWIIIAAALAIVAFEVNKKK